MDIKIRQIDLAGPGSLLSYSFDIDVVASAEAQRVKHGTPGLPGRQHRVHLGVAGSSLEVLPDRVLNGKLLTRWQFIEAAHRAQLILLASGSRLSLLQEQVRGVFSCIPGGRVLGGRRGAEVIDAEARDQLSVLLFPFYPVRRRA